jgi:hypothetical protein
MTGDACARAAAPLFDIVDRSRKCRRGGARGSRAEIVSSSSSLLARSGAKMTRNDEKNDEK